MGRSLFLLVVGFVAGWWLTAIAGVWYIEHAGIIDRDGGGAMGAFFFIGPLGGLVIAIAFTAVMVAREKAKAARAEAGLPPEPATQAWRLWRGVPAAVAVYLTAWGLVGFNGPDLSGDAMRLVVSELLPALAGLGAGVLAYRS